ncbi:MAG: glycoside hydrolase family 15 protein [Phenylobacterium sp.]|uniref:glycoside hydrolase family 15 protein n=1 Tax=Phenylobacterium sp. TaxID=1871053 RepID=UPI00391DB612
MILKADCELTIEGAEVRASVSLEAGETCDFVLTYEPSHVYTPEPCEPEAALAETLDFWRDWSGKSRYRGAWPEAVNRSLITIKALAYAPTGGIVAAPTTSLPEKIGGGRNWDYRYCWLRDATFTVLTLMNAGHRREAEAWCNWLLRAVAGDVAQLQPLYGVAGERRLPELELDWLPGYEGSRPVRIGNGAYDQLQIDVFGSVMDALHQARALGLTLKEESWGLQKALMAHLEDLWREPDEGIWEVRCEPRHFVHSKVMAWAAFDRAARAVEEFGCDGPAARWRALAAEVHAEVCERGFDPDLGAFVQAYDTKALDAATLLIPLVGFLPADDPRMVGTVRAIERDLTCEGLVLRYDPEAAPDGVDGSEGAFLACSFWLADNLILQGRHQEAEALFARLVGLCNDVGLLAEEYDPRAGRQLGNFPQAFSHFALVDTAFNLAEAKHAAAPDEPHD